MGRLYIYICLHNLDKLRISFMYKIIIGGAMIKPWFTQCVTPDRVNLILHLQMQHTELYTSFKIKYVQDIRPQETHYSDKFLS